MNKFCGKGNKEHNIVRSEEPVGREHRWQPETIELVGGTEPGNLGTWESGSCRELWEK